MVADSFGDECMSSKSCSEPKCKFMMIITGLYQLFGMDLLICGFASLKLHFKQRLLTLPSRQKEMLPMYLLLTLEGKGMKFAVIFFHFSLFYI